MEIPQPAKYIHVEWAYIAITCCLWSPADLIYLYVRRQRHLLNIVHVVSKRLSFPEYQTPRSTLCDPLYFIFSAPPSKFETPAALAALAGPSHGSSTSPRFQPSSCLFRSSRPFQGACLSRRLRLRLRIEICARDLRGWAFLVNRMYVNCLLYCEIIVMLTDDMLRG